MATDLKYTEQYQKLAFGDNGLRILAAAGTSVVGEYFGKVVATAASVISFTSSASGGDATVTSLSLAAGQEVIGNITTISVTSGNIIAYLR